MAAEQNVQTVVVVQKPAKSIVAAILLTLLFGPLGLFYASVTGGIVMLILSIVVGLFTVGIGLVITWPICVVWSAIATSKYNKQAMAT